jgi:hypothetical protein
MIPRAYRRKIRRFTTGRLVWGGLLRVVQRITHYKHGDHLEFKLGFSVHDLSEKGRAVRDQVEALVQAVQKAGSYQAREEAARAVHAVWAGLKDRLPEDVLTKVSESLPLREAAHIGRLNVHRSANSSETAGSSETAAPSESTGSPESTDSSAIDA